jgi:hypothetical protein
MVLFLCRYCQIDTHNLQGASLRIVVSNVCNCCVRTLSYPERAWPGRGMDVC